MGIDDDGGGKPGLYPLAARVEELHRDRRGWETKHLDKHEADFKEHRKEHHDDRRIVSEAIGKLQLEFARMEASVTEQIKGLVDDVKRLSDTAHDPPDLPKPPPPTPLWQKIAAFGTIMVALVTLIVYAARMPNQEKFERLVEQVNSLQLQLQLEVVRLRADIQVQRRTP